MMIPANDSPKHFDATAATFEQEVLAKSMTTPVLIDFWAPWCGPCKQLKPVLEKLADAYGGSFLLAKVNSDDEMQLASLFGVRSLPTVILVKDGQPVDGFAGAQPESALRQFLAKNGIEPAASEDVADTDAAAPVVAPEQRVTQLRDEIAAAPDKPELQLDLALALAQLGETSEALGLLDKLPANLATDDRAKRARATLGFAAKLSDAPPAGELERRLQADENDHQARYFIAVRALVGGDQELALQQLIELLRRDRNFDDGIAKRSLIDAFSIIEDAALVGRYRRQMATLLF